jgi:hypothetical protein
MENTLYNNTYPWNRQHPNKKAAAEKAAKQPKVREPPPFRHPRKLATPVLSISCRPHVVSRCLQNKMHFPCHCVERMAFRFRGRGTHGADFGLPLVMKKVLPLCDEIIITIELALLREPHRVP